MITDCVAMVTCTTIVTQEELTNFAMFSYATGMYFEYLISGLFIRYWYFCNYNYTTNYNYSELTARSTNQNSYTCYAKLST